MSHKYKVLGELGAGGMGVVMRAVQEGLGREVALKMLHKEMCDDPHLLDRFRREVETCAALTHPNIVKVFDTGVAGGKLYYAMELLDAQDLDGKHENTPLTADDAVPLIEQAADALAYLHERGIFHRDLKPSNMMVDERGHLTLMDFGLVRVDGRTMLTEPGRLLGTPRFMPPENFTGAEPSHAAGDVYSLGLAFWELISGERPYRQGDIRVLIRDLLSVVPRPLSEIRPEVPVWLSQLIADCIDKDPSQRPSATQVRDRCRRRGDERTEGPASVRPRSGSGSGRITRKSLPRIVPVPAPAAELPSARWWPVVVLVACVGAGGFRLLQPSLDQRGPEGAPTLAPRAPSSPLTGAVGGLTVAPAPGLPAGVGPEIAAGLDLGPIRNLICVPTDISVLVDFDKASSTAVRIEVGPFGGRSQSVNAVAAGSTRGRAQFFGLRPSSAYFLRVRGPDGATVFGDLRFETLQARHSGDVAWVIATLDKAKGGIEEVATTGMVQAPDPRVVPTIVKVLGHKNELNNLCRERLGRVVELLRDPAGTDVLHEDLKRAPLDLSLQYLRSLAAAGDPRAVPAALRMLAGRAWDHAEVLCALGQRESKTCHDLIDELLVEKSGRPWSGLGRALVLTDPERGSRRLVRLLDETGPTDGIWPALEGLSTVGGPLATAALARRLDPSTSRSLYHDVALALALVGGPQADDALRAALLQEGPTVGLLLAAALRRLDQVTSGILAATELGKTPDVRSAAALALGMVPATDGVGERLATLLDEPAGPLLDAASWAVGNARVPVARSALARCALSDRDIQGRAALALAQIGDRGPSGALAQLARRLSSRTDTGTLMRRSRVGLALAILGDSSGAATLAELGRVTGRDGAFARWLVKTTKETPGGWFNGRPDSAAPVRDKAAPIWVDPISPIHPTGIRLRAGQSVSLKVDGLWGWGGPAQAVHRPERELPRGGPTRGSYWLNPHARDPGFPSPEAPPSAVPAPYLKLMALIGGVTVPLKDSWTLVVAPREGELILWTLGDPHQQTPGRDPGLLGVPVSGIAAVRIRW